MNRTAILLALPVRAATGTSWGMLTLTALVEILALVFLVTGGAALFLLRRRQRQNTLALSVHAPAQARMVNWPLRNLRFPPIFALIVPIVMLSLIWLNGWLPLSGSNNLAHPTMTITSPTKTSSDRLNIVPISLSSLLSNGILVAPGTLTIGTSAIFPEQVYPDQKNQSLVGFDVDLIKDIAHSLQLTTNLTQMDFAALKDSLNKKKVDVVIAAYPLPSDNKSLLQSIPYLAPREVILTLKQGAKISKVASLSDLCGFTVGVLKDSNEDKALHNTVCADGSPMNIVEKDNVDAVGQLLANQQVAATYQDSPSSLYYLGIYRGEFQPVASFPGTTQEAILIKSDNTVLAQAIRTAFERLRQDGIYKQLLNNWNLMGDALPSPGTSPTGAETP